MRFRRFQQSNSDFSTDCQIPVRLSPASPGGDDVSIVRPYTRGSSLPRDDNPKGPLPTAQSEVVRLRPSMDEDITTKASPSSLTTCVRRPAGLFNERKLPTKSSRAPAAGCLGAWVRLRGLAHSLSLLFSLLPGNKHTATIVT